MDLQNGNRKSLRVKRKNVFLEDHVQSGVVFEGDLESLDDKGLEKSDLEGKYTTYMWKFVQSAPVVTFSIVEQRLSEDESQKSEKSENNSPVNSEMEEKVDDPDLQLAE